MFWSFRTPIKQGAGISPLVRVHGDVLANPVQTYAAARIAR